MESAQFGILPPGGLIPPKGLNAAMEGLVREVLMKNPKDVFAFAAEYFETLIEIRNKANFGEDMEINSCIYKFRNQHELNGNTLKEKKSDDNISSVLKNNVNQLHHTESQNSNTIEPVIESPLNVENIEEDEEETNVLEDKENLEMVQNLNVQVIETEKDDSIEINNFELHNEMSSDGINSEDHIADQNNKEEETELSQINISNSQEVTNDNEETLDTKTEDQIINSFDGTEDNFECRVRIDSITGEVIQPSTLNTDEIQEIDATLIENSESELCLVENVVETQQKLDNDTNIDEITQELKNDTNVEETIQESTMNAVEIEKCNELLKSDEVEQKDVLENNATEIDVLAIDKVNEDPEEKISDINDESKNDLAKTIPALIELETNVDLSNETTISEVTETSELNKEENMMIDNVNLSHGENIDLNKDETIVQNENTTGQIVDSSMISENNDSVEINEDKVDLEIENTNEFKSETKIEECAANEEKITEVDIVDNNTNENVLDDNKENENITKESSTVVSDTEIIKEPTLEGNESITHKKDDPTEIEKFGDGLDKEVKKLKQQMAIESKTTSDENVESRISTDEITQDNNEIENKHAFEKAAILIQRVFRGFMVRSKMSNLHKDKRKILQRQIPQDDSKNDNSLDCEEAEQDAHIIHANVEPALYTLPEEKNDSSDSTEDESSTFSSAATKIQAGVRGYLTRKYFQRNRTNNSTDTTAPSIGEDSKSLDEIGNMLESHISTEDTVNQMIVTSSSILAEQLEHFEQFDSTNLESFDVSRDGDDPSGIRVRKRLKREDAIQLHSPYSSEETSNVRESPLKVSEDEEPIGDLAQSIITEIVENSYEPVVEITQNVQSTPSELVDVEIHSEEQIEEVDASVKKSLHEENVMTMAEEQTIQIEDLNAVEDNESSNENIKLVEDIELSNENIKAVEDNDPPNENTKAVEDNEPSNENIKAVEDNESNENINAMEDYELPNENIKPVEDNEPSNEDIKVMEDNVLLNENIKPVEEIEPPNEDIKAMEDNELPNENIKPIEDNEPSNENTIEGLTEKVEKYIVNENIPRISKNESFQSDDSDVIVGPVRLSRPVSSEPLEQRIELKDSQDANVKDEIQDLDEDDNDEVFLKSTPRTTLEVIDDHNHVKSSLIIEDNMESVETKGLIHSGEFHDTVLLPTKIIRKSTSIAKD